MGLMLAPALVSLSASEWASARLSVSQSAQVSVSASLLALVSASAQHPARP
jgi:hypothetical protein